MMRDINRDHVGAANGRYVERKGWRLHSMPRFNIEKKGEMRVLSTLFLVSSAIVCGPPAKYACTPATPVRTTVWGHNHVLVDLTDKPLALLRGSVRTFSGEGVEGALVEVLNLGGATRRPTETSEDARTRPRLAACITGQTGGFAFDLPPGRYELLTSKPDWNSTSVVVLVDARKGKRRDILIPLNVGD
jgi:hypothetical protein